MRKNDNISLKDIITIEKTQMLPSNFIFSYIVVPIYILLTISLLVAFGVLMQIDDNKYILHGIIIVAVFALMSIALLASVPFVRKSAIKKELDRYNFDTATVQPRELWDFSTDEYKIKFDKNGMYVNDELYYYNHLYKSLVTSNRYQRITICILFALSEEQTIFLPVNPDSLKMLECLEITLDNDDDLQYILSNKEMAFEKIFRTGAINNKK